MLQIPSHSGTHMDAPSHLLRSGSSLDVLPISQFCGRAVALDVTFLPAGGIITADFLRAQNGALLSADFVLFYTGWEKKWGTGDESGAFPVPDAEAARYLVSCGLKGVGIDAPSMDPLNDRELKAHRVLLEGGLVILENLCLRKVMGRGPFMLYALPLKFANADGAPIRAIADFRELPDKECEKE